MQLVPFAFEVLSSRGPGQHQLLWMLSVILLLALQAQPVWLEVVLWSFEALQVLFDYHLFLQLYLKDHQHCHHFHLFEWHC